VAPPPQVAQQLQSALPSLAPLVDSVKAAVVNVDVQSRGGRGEAGGPGGAPMGPDDLFDQFFGRRRPRGQDPVRQGMGSGTIVDGRGLVLTNNHVVEGAIAIRVRLDDGRSFDAEIVGRDPLTDVALIRLKGKLDHLPVAKLGDSDAIKVGDWVLAIGNPFGLASSVSLGIISAKERNIGATAYDDFLQTDAAINPGNSGGPLFNLKGEIVGINTAIVGGGTGIGFAVPSNIAKELIPQLEKSGTVTRGWLGVAIQTLNPELAKAMNAPVKEGAVVLSVNDNTPAKKAGLKPDDIVVAIDGAKVTTSDALSRIVAFKRPGSTSTLSVYRAGKKLDVKVALGTRPNLDGEGKQEPPAGSDDERNKQKIGIAFQDMDPRAAEQTGLPNQGALVSEVVPGSPAERAGLDRGMLITEAARQPVKNAADLSRILRAQKPGTSVLLRAYVPAQNGPHYVLRALTVP
jgi:serine protease Do